MCGIWNTDVMARDKSMENGTVNNRITSEKEFEEVFRYYYRPLFLFAYGYVMDEGEAENIVQSVFTETKKFAGEFESESLSLFFGKTCLFTLF